jgi:tetratricopeptide (TPR) repeat protein
MAALLMSSFPGLARKRADASMRYDGILIAGVAAAWLCGAVPALSQSGADTARLLADKAYAEQEQGMQEQALLDLNQAIELRALPASEQARLIFDRGVILDAQGWLDQAAGDYSAAIALAPRFAPALNNRANVYRRQNRLDDARRDYLASLTMGNEQPEYSWYGLGQVAEAQGDKPAARTAYGRAIAANPSYRLAADRLSVLGDQTVLADGLPPPAVDEVIHLKPPAPVASAAAAPITLKPPRENAVAAVPPRAPPSITPAKFDPAGPGLRPALDNTGGGQVQLGAWRSEEEAGAGWNKAVARAGGLLEGLVPHIVAAQLPGRGRYYRLRVGPLTGSAAELCAALSARGQDCIPARN